MKDFYVVIRMSDDGYAISDVPVWVHRHRPGVRKAGLRGWRTLDGVLKSKAWRDRAAEASVGYRVEVAKLVEVGPPGEERDALETVHTASLDDIT